MAQMPDPIPLQRAPSVRFAHVARRLAEAARAEGLDVPDFRSPPVDDRLDRTIRRRPGGTAVVAVRVRSRPFVAVVADLVEGIVAVNDLDGVAAAAARATLWAEVAAEADADLAAA